MVVNLAFLQEPKKSIGMKWIFIYEWLHITEKKAVWAYIHLTEIGITFKDTLMSSMTMQEYTSVQKLVL